MLHTKKVTRKQKVLTAGVLAALIVCGSAAAFAVQSPVAVAEEKTHKADLPDSSASAQQLPPDESGNVPAEPPKGEATEPTLEEQSVQDGDTPAEPPKQTTEPSLNEQAGQESRPDSSAVKPEEPAAGQEPKPEEEEQPEEQPIPEKYQNAVRGDAQLIIARGGTILPDDDPEAYRKINGVYYKQYASKESTEDLLYLRTEYEVGNWDLLSPVDQKLAEETLVDGDYPKNSSGESYGTTLLSSFVGYKPDLVSAQGTHGERGYIRQAEIDAIPDFFEKDCPHEFIVPLYDSEGTVIGEFSVGCGGHLSETMTLEEAREAALKGPPY